MALPLVRDTDAVFDTRGARVQSAVVLAFSTGALSLLSLDIWRQSSLLIFAALLLAAVWTGIASLFSP